MGLDPDNDSVTPGSGCVAFKDFFEIDFTPKRIQVTLSGLVLCPLGFQPPPPGVMIVQQTPGIDVCRWFGQTGDHFALLTWGALPRLSVSFQSLLGNRHFRGRGETDGWDNDLVCGPTPTNQYHLGRADIYWGPDI